MRNILLPTDFSDNAYNAIAYAVQLFHHELCTFHLLNCYAPVYYDSDFIHYSPASTLTQTDVHRKSSKKNLTKVKTRIKTEFPDELHNFKIISSFNPLKEELNIQAKKIQPDAVIMGTQGATGAKQILFGSHTVNAIKKTDFPLIAIPSNYSFRLPKKILFPTDYEINYTKEHLKPLTDLAKKFSSDIDVLHVSFASHPPTLPPDGQKIIAGFLKDIPHDFSYIKKSTVPEGITFYQKDSKVDFLAMISNRHTPLETLLFRPVTNEIGFKITTPFLVIPSGKYNK